MFGYRDRAAWPRRLADGDRKSTRLNSSHLVISYAVFWLKKQTLASTLVGMSGGTARAPGWIDFMLSPFVLPPVSGSAFPDSSLSAGFCLYNRHMRLVPQL